MDAKWDLLEAEQWKIIYCTDLLFSSSSKVTANWECRRFTTTTKLAKNRPNFQWRMGRTRLQNRNIWEIKILLWIMILEIVYCQITLVVRVPVIAKTFRGNPLVWNECSYRIWLFNVFHAFPFECSWLITFLSLIHSSLPRFRSSSTSYTIQLSPPGSGINWSWSGIRNSIYNRTPYIHKFIAA